MKRHPEIYLNLDDKQMGAGGIDSWSLNAFPMSPYRISSGEKRGRSLTRCGPSPRRARNNCGMTRPMMTLAAAALGTALAQSAGVWQIGPFVRPPGAMAVIAPKKDSSFVSPTDGKAVHWEALHTFNPAAIVRNGKIYVLYRAEDDSGEMRIGLHTSRLGLAESEDGIHFTRRPTPVLYPDNDAEKEREWPGGCEDPRIVESEDGTYVLTYTQWNRKKTDVGIATSKDLIHWQKHGPALGTDGKYGALSYKSAGIVTRVVKDRLIAARIKGKYWMYWGEISIRLATSDDLIHWKVLEDVRRATR